MIILERLAMVRLPPLVAFILLAPAAALAQPALRASVVVDTPVIHLGDLFTGAGAHAGAAIAPAPSPGHSVVFDAAWLSARAAEQHLDWRPRSGDAEVKVARAGEAVTAEAIAAQLKRALGDRLPAGLVRIDLDNTATRLFVAPGASPALTVDNLTYNERTGRLTALVAASSDGATDDPVRVTGRVLRMVELPVLARPVVPGEVIAKSDVDTIAVRADRMNETYFTDAADLIGKTPRRAIRPGEPIRPSDVQVPIVIHKGDLVTLILRTPSLMLTARAKALEDGAQGAAIRLANTQSGRTLDAVVTGPGTASVSLTVPRVAAR